MDSIYKTANIKDFYKLDKILGEGSYAIVRKAIRKSDNLEVAVKIIDKASLESDDHLAIQSEVEIMSQIDHPNIVKVLEVFDDKSKLYIVLELMTGGELFDRIVEKELYSQLNIKISFMISLYQLHMLMNQTKMQQQLKVIKNYKIFIQISYIMKKKQLMSLDQLLMLSDVIHTHNLFVQIVTLWVQDLKPENILYTTPDPDATVKISDFGVAKVISDELMLTACGTPGYVAPEILTGVGYDMAVDYWSIGVILYVLLCGYPPFYEESNEKLFEQIKSGKIDFSGEQWEKISKEAKDLVEKLLKVDPKQRYKADQICKHPWITGEKALTKDLSDVTEKLRELNARRKLRRAQLMVLATTKLQRRIQQHQPKN